MSYFYHAGRNRRKYPFHFMSPYKENKKGGGCWCVSQTVTWTKVETVTCMSKSQVFFSWEVFNLCSEWKYNVHVLSLHSLNRCFWSSLSVSISVSWIGILDQKFNAGLIGTYWKHYSSLDECWKYLWFVYENQCWMTLIYNSFYSSSLTSNLGS